ncbi:MAG: hypothetical protein Q4C53_07730 [Clostridia bacterium]|nr:hypothetical protein [Clostridia bacterium]
MGEHVVRNAETEFAAGEAYGYADLVSAVAAERCDCCGRWYPYARMELTGGKLTCKACAAERTAKNGERSPREALRRARGTNRFYRFAAEESVPSYGRRLRTAL